MKFKAENKILKTVDWKDGAIFTVKKPCLTDIIGKRQLNQLNDIGYMAAVLEETIISWVGILDDDESGKPDAELKPLPCTVENKKQIVNVLLYDEEFRKKLEIVLGGELHSLVIGLSASTTTDGTRTNVTSAK